MLGNLDDFLDAVAPPEFALKLRNASDVLQSMGINSHENEITHTLAMIEDRDNGDILHYIEQQVCIAMNNAMYELGIILHDAPTHIMVALLKGVNALQDYGDPQTVIDVIDNGESPEEIFAEVLEMVTDCDWDDFLACFTSIHPGLVDRLRSVQTELLSSLNVEEGEATDTTIIRRRLKAFLNGRTDLIINTAIADGISLSLPIDTYVEQAGDYLSDLSPRQVAVELYAMGLASCAETGQVVDVVRDQFELILTDVNDISAAHAELNNLIQEKPNEQT